MRISQAEFLAMQARCDKARAQGVVEQPAPVGVSKESNLHNDIIEMNFERGEFEWKCEMCRAHEENEKN